MRLRTKSYVSYVGFLCNETIPLFIVPKLGGECYDSVYLGVNIDDEMRNKIINAAKNLNPNIKIYQMKADANAFKLQTEQII